MTTDTNAMEYAIGYSIGVQRNGDGEHLFVVDGKIVGTVKWLKELIQTFEEESLANKVIEIVRDAQRRRVL